MRIIRIRITIRTGVIIMDEFLLRALIGACVLAAMLGPLGAFVVWRHMAYFGDTIAHSALLGVALALWMQNEAALTPVLFFVAVMVALILARYVRDTRFHADTVLGILSHGALSLGLVLVALNRSVTLDINTFLFGDVLAITWGDVGILVALAVVVLTTIRLHWRTLLMATIDPAIAQVEGIRVARQQLILTLLLAGVIAVAIKLTGALLITALLIMPAASARYLAKTPVQMAVLASMVGMASVSAGLYGSLRLDTPSGPMMVLAAACAFILCAMLGRTQKA